MQDSRLNKFRPLNDRVSLLCILTFMSSFLLILGGIIVSIIQFLYIGIAFAIINVIAVVFSIKKWNSFVYVDDGKITQYQFGKKVSIRFDEIDSVEVVRSLWPILKIYANKEAIIFDINSGIRPFFDKCSDERLKNDIKELLEKNCIVLPNINLEYKQYKIRPLFGECLGLSIFTFMLSFLLILGGIIESIIQFLYIGIAFAIINVIVVFFSIKKWNNWVYMDDEKISQYQFGKEITFYYDEIDYVKILRSGAVRSSPKIKIYKDKKAITFDIISGVRPFFMKCSNDRVKNEIKALLKKKYILLPNNDFE